MAHLPIDTPCKIEVLLHCHCVPLPHPQSLAPAVEDALTFLQAAGAIKPVGGREDVFTTTPLGIAWVRALCNVPRPKLVYLDEMGRQVGEG